MELINNFINIVQNKVVGNNMRYNSWITTTILTNRDHGTCKDWFV